MEGVGVDVGNVSGFCEGERGGEGERERKKQRKTQYDAHVKRGIRDLVNMSGPSAAAFGEDLKNGISSELMANMMPEEVAKVYFDQGYADADEVMKAFVHVAATEIGAEPEVRAWFRDEFLGHATISTYPTPEGTDVIDPWHPIAAVKRLARMPVYILGAEQFAQILEGKRRGLLKVDIGFVDARFKSVLEREAVGTDVILHLLDEEKEFIEPERIKSLIKK